MDEKQLVFMQYLYEAFDICSTVYQDGVRQALAGNDMQYFFEKQLARGKDLARLQEDIPYLRQTAEKIYLWVISHGGQVWLVGPVGSIYLNNKQLRSFSHEYHIPYAEMRIPRYDSTKIVKLMKFTVFGLFGLCLEEENIYRYQSISWPSWEKDIIQYELEKAQTLEGRSSYAYEQQWLQAIENGELQEPNREILPLDSGYYGILSRDSDYKQLEYMAVSSVTLATRAAIRGGVQPDRAYALSDLLLQRLSDCDNILQVSEVITESMTAFPKLVRENQRKRRDEIVELCKDYIAKHLYHPFTTGQMARDLGIARSYMSSHFSAAEGQTIQQYILTERLQAAANLLKYSEEPVAQISDYMQFSSPGRFAGYFKKRYGCSPSQYRKENKVNEFIEKNK